MRAPALLAPRSEVTVDAQGIVWLAPRRASLRARHTAASFLLALLLLAAMAVFSLLPGLPGIIASLPLTAGGVALVLATARTASTRAGLSHSGIVILSGTDAAQLGWAALTSVRGAHVGGRVRVVLCSRETEVASRATFEAGPAREWLNLARAEACRRRLDPRPVASGLGFVTG